MRKPFLLFLSVLLFCGAGTSLHLPEHTGGEGYTPPTLEEIHLDLLMTHTPTKPKSIGIPPVCAWYNATDRTLIIDPKTETGWFTISIEDETETVLLFQMINGELGSAIIDINSLRDDYYVLTIRGGISNPFVLAGWFEVH